MPGMFATKFIRVAVIVSWALAGGAQDSAPAAPDAQQQSLRNAERLGAAIFRQDRAAALATDSALELRKFRRDKRLGGWLIDEAADGYHVTFFGTTDELPLAALYRVKVSPDGGRADKAVAVDPPEPLTAEEALQHKVRQFALAQEFMTCSRKYNTVVLRQPDAAGERWVVYLLAATTDARLVPAGGHHRFDISADGATLLSRRKFTNSCLDMPREKDAVALTLSHLLDDHPTEIHVFLSFYARMPVYLLTMGNRAVWKIENGEIQFLKVLDEREEK